MDRPYVIRHMLTSLDGKIDGPFMSAPEARAVAAEYGRLRTTFDCQAAMYGATTMEEVYAEGRAPALEPCGSRWPREDYAAQFDADNYILSMDPVVDGGDGASLFRCSGILPVTAPFW